MPIYYSGIMAPTSKQPDQVANLLWWWRADLGITGDDPVTEWLDQSGNSYDLASTTSGTTDVLAAEINGQDAIKVSSGHMTTGVILNQAPPIHVFTVARPDTANSVAYCISLASTKTDFLFTQDTGLVIEQYNNKNQISIVQNNWYIFESYFSSVAGESFQRLDKGSKVDGENPSLGGNHLRVSLGSYNGTGNTGSFTYAEVFAYSAEIAGSDLNALMKYLSGRYGIT